MHYQRKEVTFFLLFPFPPKLDLSWNSFWIYLLYHHDLWGLSSNCRKKSNSFYKNYFCRNEYIFTVWNYSDTKSIRLSICKCSYYFVVPDWKFKFLCIYSDVTDLVAACLNSVFFALRGFIKNVLVKILLQMNYCYKKISHRSTNFNCLQFYFHLKKRVKV